MDKAEEKRWSFWNSHDGYLPGFKAPVHDHHGEEEGRAEEEEEEKPEYMPRRSVAPGLHMGLTVLLDVQEDEYYFTGPQSVGFKALMHPATEIPELVEFGFALQPGTESFVAVDPEMIQADDAIHKFSTVKRQCYLEDEKELLYFKHYSFLNCFLECSTNYTFQVSIGVT